MTTECSQLAENVVMNFLDSRDGESLDYASDYRPLKNGLLLFKALFNDVLSVAKVYMEVMVLCA